MFADVVGDFVEVFGGCHGVSSFLFVYRVSGWVLPVLAGVASWGVASSHVFPDLLGGDAVECRLVYRPTGVVPGCCSPQVGFYTPRVHIATRRLRKSPQMSSLYPSS